jgi:hypothetical protein
MSGLLKRLARRPRCRLTAGLMKRIAVLALSLFASATLFAADTFPVSALTFTLPDGWKSVQPSSAMRKAQLSIPGKEGGKSADVTFFHFGNEGGAGGVQANVQRWFGQFSSAEGAQKTEPLDFGGTKVTVVSTEGTMKGGQFGGPATDEPEFALLGAIIEHADGPVFIKATGPIAVLKDSREKFMAMVKSAVEKK